MPRGHENDPVYSLGIYARFSSQFVIGEKIVVPCLNVIMIAFLKVLFFAQNSRVNTERVLPRHTIILVKSNTFNMAAVSIKRFIRAGVDFSIVTLFILPFFNVSISS